MQPWIGIEIIYTLLGTLLLPKHVCCTKTEIYGAKSVQIEGVNIATQSELDSLNLDAPSSRYSILSEEHTFNLL